MSAHPFDDALALTPLGEGRWRGTTSDGYWNMVGPFGGYVAALLLKTAIDDPRREGQPVALTVNFCAAVQKGAFDLVATPVRTGGSTQHWTIALEQDDTVAATATALFGARPETFAATVATAPTAPDPATLDRFTGFDVGWTKRYDLRFAAGAPDGDGDDDGQSRSLLWIGQRPPRPLDFPALAAICDIFFGRIIHVRRRMVPFGTVSMTAYFHATTDDLAAIGTDFVLGDADARIFDRGLVRRNMERRRTPARDHPPARLLSRSALS